MQKNEMDIQLNNQKGILCFYAYYAVMVLTKAIGLDSNNSLYMVMFLLGCLLLLYKLIVTEYTLAEIVKALIFVGVGGICALIASEKTIVLLAITIVGLKHCDFRETVRVAFWVRLVITVPFMLLALGEIFEPGLEDLMTTRFEWIKVYHFGYSTPNNAFISIFIILVLYLYLRYEWLNYKHFVVTSVITMVFYELTNSRTGTLLMFGLWALIFVDKFLTRERLRKVYYWLLAASTFLCGIFSWAATMLYQPTGSYAWEFVNRVFSGRLNITQRYYRILSATWLPRDNAAFEELSGYGFIDNMYMNVFMHDGILLYLLLLVLITFSNYRLYRAHCYRELVFVTVFSVYAILEEFPLNPTVNPFILFVGILMYSEITIGNQKYHWLKTPEWIAKLKKNWSRRKNESEQA